MNLSNQRNGNIKKDKLYWKVEKNIFWMSPCLIFSRSVEPRSGGAPNGLTQPEVVLRWIPIGARHDGELARRLRQLLLLDLPERGPVWARHHGHLLPVRWRLRLVKRRALTEARDHRAKLAVLAVALRSLAKLGQARPMSALLWRSSQGVQVLDEAHLFRRQQRRLNAALDGVELGPHRPHADSRNGALVGTEFPDVVRHNRNQIRNVKAEKRNSNWKRFLSEIKHVIRFNTLAAN